MTDWCPIGDTTKKLKETCYTVTDYPEALITNET